MADKGTPQRKLSCDICNVHGSSAFQLYEHVVGHRHRTVAKRVSPECLLHIHRLQYFIDTYMKLEAMVGLEYVEEWQEPNKSHYKCVLCGFHGDGKPTFLHITGPDHIARYLRLHHPRFHVRKGSYSQKSEYLKALQRAAADVCEMYGKKEIKEFDALISQAPTPSKMAPASSDPKTESDPAPDINGDHHARPLRRPERKGDDRQEETEFTGNGDFLDYLRRFQIRNGEDARIIKQIMLNCTQALVRFREEQAQPNVRWEEQAQPNVRWEERAQPNVRWEERAQPNVRWEEQAQPNARWEERAQPNARWEEQAQPNVWRGEFLGGPPAATNQTDNGRVITGPGPRADATEMFFNSIKNMEESEVGGILQKIAATNAAFRGINVPSVIKYLQATGRLKPS